MTRIRTAILVAACNTYDERTDQLCTGTLRYGWGQTDASCDTCLARCGIAVATWLRVEQPIGEPQGGVERA